MKYQIRDKKIKRSNTSSTRDSESGNVLFLILIAVALFAALSFVIAQSTRSGSGSISEEKANLLASEILNYSVAVTTGLTRLISNGCTLEQVNFEREPFNGSNPQYANPVSPTDFRCHIFHPGGAGVLYHVPPLEAQDIPAGQEYEMREYYYNLSNQVIGVGTDNQGNFNSASKEFLIMMPYVSLQVCQALNKAIRRQHEDPPEATAISLVGFWGGDLEAVGTSDIEDTAGHLHGQMTACAHTTNVFGPPTAGPGYYFYNAMLVR